MADFGIMKITNLGANLYAKAQTGTQIQFTKLQVGSGTLPGGTIIEDLTSLVTPEFDVTISSIDIDTINHKATVSGIKDNVGVITGITTKELGLFATDPDIGEILYAYANAGDFGDYIPPESSGLFTRTYKIDAATGNASNVTIVVPAESYVTKEYVDAVTADLTDDVNAHLADYATFKTDTETQLADYNMSVTSTDANGKPTQTQYTRQDATLYLQVDATNPDANGNYQTITEQYYDTDGTTLLKTVTWTLTYNADGLVTGRTWVVS